MVSSFLLPVYVGADLIVNLFGALVSNISDHDVALLLVDNLSDLGTVSLKDSVVMESMVGHCWGSMMSDMVSSMTGFTLKLVRAV